MRTTDGVSKVVSAPQTLGSIILFSLIYALLFAVFLYVLNDKIQHVPDPVTPGRPGGDAGPGGLAAVTGLRAGTGGASLTMPGDGPAPADSQSSN